MIEETIGKRVRQFKNEHETVHDEDHSEWPSAIKNDLVNAVDLKICEVKSFTINTLSI